MFSFVIALVSIALVAALTLATLYYGGSSWLEGGEQSRATLVLTQGQQVMAAADLFYADRHRWPNSMNELVEKGYLQNIPGLSAKSASLAPSLSVAGEAYAQSTFTMQVWTMPVGGRPTFVLSNAVNPTVCGMVNQKSRGDDGILVKPHISLSSQCFGQVNDKLIVVLTKEASELGNTLAPLETISGPLPTDFGSVEWLVPPSKPLTNSLLNQDDPTGGAGSIDLTGIEFGLNPGAAKEAVVGNPYSFDLNTFLTENGEPTTRRGFKWSVISNSLPSGIFLTKDGYLSGSANIEGAGSITVRVAYGSFTADQTFTLRAVPLFVDFTSTSIPAAKFEEPYSYDLSKIVTSNDAAFSTSGVSYSATGLPSWLNLNSQGVLSGTPPAIDRAGTSFEVVASYMDKLGRRVFTIIVAGVALDVTKISAGREYTCAVTVTGGAKCWGYGSSGQLGDDGPNKVWSAVPVDVYGLQSGVDSIEVGWEHTCAVTTGGAVKCWGKNDYGQLGNNSTVTSRVPVDVEGLQSGVKKVAVGYNFSCALKSSGRVACWGVSARLGLGGNNLLGNKLVPVEQSSSGVIDIALGLWHGCLLTTSGRPACWGESVYGETAQSVTYGEIISSPRTVMGVTNATSIASSFNHTCAVTASGALYCWGKNSYGQLGNHTKENETLYTSSKVTPVKLLTSGVGAVAPGDEHTCALMDTGAVKCWGMGTGGQLGYGGNVNKKTPQDVVGLSSGAVGITSGYRHSCAILKSGSLKCWGYNPYGMGVTPVKDYNYTPVDVPI